MGLLGLLRKLRDPRPDPFDLILSRQANPLITLLKSAAIGDTVLLSAVVRDLRAALPGCRLRLACGSSNAALARMVPGVDEVVVLPMSKPVQLWRMRRRLRSDVFVDFDSWPRINALIAFGSGSRATIGFRTPGQHRHALYDSVIDHSTSLHEVENYRRLVQPLIADIGARLPTPARPWLQLPELRHGTAEDAAHVVVFHMFAGGSQASFKEWPEASWRALALDLVERGFEVRLTGGPAELERNQSFARRVGKGDKVCAWPVTGLAELGAWLKGTATVVAVDTGVAHLAAAVGAPTLVLHGPTSPQRWGALGPVVRYLKDAQTPWIQLGFEVSDGGTPVQLSLEEVRAAVTALATR
ncbi:MAG: glycosyltransferase family 9 protein [Burkholderiales bacterium]